MAEAPTVSAGCLRSSSAGSSSSSHEQAAAVDVDRRARDVAGGVRREEADEVPDLDRSTQTLYREGLSQLIESLVRCGAVRKFRVEDPRANRVDRDAVRPELFR